MSPGGNGQPVGGLGGSGAHPDEDVAGAEDGAATLAGHGAGHGAAHRR